MEEVIRVQVLESGRVVAKVEPLGPAVQAGSLEEAVERARSAHRAYLSQQPRWLPPGMPLSAVHYRVVGGPA